MNNTLYKTCTHYHYHFLRSSYATLQIRTNTTWPVAGVDVSRAREVLGLKEYVDWKKTVEDTTRALLEVEKSWGSQ